MKNNDNTFWGSFILIVFFLIGNHENSIGQNHFYNKVDSSESQIRTLNDFWKAQFHSYVTFRGAHFYSTANFNEAQFYSRAYIAGIQCDTVASFGNTIFNSHAIFDWAQFHYEVDFVGTRFDSSANFIGTHFFSFVAFHEAKFNTTANFSLAKFDTASAFINTVLPDTLYLEDVITKEEIDFTTARLDSIKKSINKNYKCMIDVLHSDIRKIKINYELFQLWFPTNTPYETKISTYEKFLKKFKDDGFNESYKNLDIEYKDFVYKSNGDYFLNCFQKIWWNYGYSKERVIYWSLALLFFLTLINFKLFDKLQNDVYNIEFNFYKKEDFEERINNSKTTKSQKLLSTLLFKFFNPLIYTNIIFFGVSIKIDRFKKFSGLVLYVWIIYTIGLFCLAYIFNIIIVK